ncbi:hypothetical protein [Janthinobacterium sp. B9-8]|uniref:hypothetical protein n=1 Tax=Janthinobacterium sp. B9-8 TaxID=1236179 RepID=UPI00061D04FC|nr:hypothetical protein [Janthinobacterium sp. B9-8]AMC36514.1 hypothetical protein VN23_18940 [Janthinobacterium sp. B9-8]
MATQQIHTEIEQFFNTYCLAYNQQNSPNIARVFAVPSGIAQHGQYTHFPSPDSTASNMQKLCQWYAEHGFLKASFKINQLFLQGAQHAIADINWQIERKQQAPWQFHTTYNLIKTSQGWLILLCTAYEESFT